MTHYKEFRADNWPLCPVCEEDELYSVLMLHDGPKPTVQDCLKGEMRCYRCGWNNAEEVIQDAIERMRVSL